MRKKHFQALAHALHLLKPSVRGAGDLEQWETDVWGVAEVCQAANANFDRARFIEACETGTCRGMRQGKAR